MEVVLPGIRISGKRSQEQQEEEQPKKAKSEDDEMDIRKIEYEEVIDSRSGDIVEQELVQMARKEELDFMEKFGVYEYATIE